MTATIRQRNVILEGDHVVASTDQASACFECVILKTFTMLMVNKIDRAPNPMELLQLPCHKKLNLVT